MSTDAKTNWGFIARLASARGSEEDWREFDRIYRRLIRVMASQSGLRAAEIDDVEQETMQTIWKKMSGAAPDFKASPEFGSFRGWLRLVVRRRIQDQFRKRLPANDHGGGAADQTARTATVERIPDRSEADWTAAFDEEFRRHLYEEAWQRVRKDLNPLHYQIFDYYVLRQFPMEKVTRSLEVSESLVYTTKNRVTKKLAKEVQKLEKAIERTVRKG